MLNFLSTVTAIVVGLWIYNNPGPFVTIFGWIGIAVLACIGIYAVYFSETSDRVADFLKRLVTGK